MRQSTTSTSNNYEIDPRTRETLLAQIEALAASYVPQWQFDRQRPDIGSVLALLFADQLMENIKRYNLTLERDYVELINMLGISLRPAAPAHALVQVSLAGETVAGVSLAAGTKLLGSVGDDEKIVFETAHGIFVTPSKLTAAFMTAADHGSIRPLLGSFPDARFLEETPVADDEDEEYIPEGAKERLLRYETPYPFTFFDVKESNYGVYGLSVCHPYLFDVEGNEILMELDGGEDVFAALFEGRLSLLFYGRDGFVPVTDLRMTGETRMAFTKELPCKKVSVDKREYSMILFCSRRPVTEELSFKDIRFASCGGEQPAGIVWNGSRELPGARFLPFGETLGLYDELYIGHPSYFSKPGARITLRFSLSFGEHLVTIPKAEEDATLKIIKRKPKKDYFGTVAQVYAEEISFEYFDGALWRRLSTTTPTAQLFNTDSSAQVELSFLCPHDWQRVDAEGLEMHCIRMQLLKADNCYYQPANHHYPIISKLTLSYSYEEQFERPHRLFSFCGSDRQDVTASLMNGQGVPVLRRHPYRDDALYLCFSGRMEEGPVSLMFRMDDTQAAELKHTEVYYSCRDGWERLKLVDYTADFGHTGTILFLPPSDFSRRTLEGTSGFWLKICRERKPGEPQEQLLPRVLGIELNVAEVDNVETMEFDDYYIDAVEPDMDFALNAKNILAVEVWVNETELHSEQAKRALLNAYPAITYAQYNFLGDIEQFYVRWREVDNFDRSQASDRHFVVDRMNNRLHFGDGVHVRIPRATEGVAFRVRISCCNGEQANLGAGQINESAANILFVDEIKNPIRAYGGRNMETMDGALRRGTALLNGRGRLVTQVDYERAALSFSSGILQVKAVVGQKKDGTHDPAAISLVVLMKDFEDGPFSFIHMRERLLSHLLDACELSVEPEKLFIVEPTFVRVSVEAWMDILQTDDSFQVQGHLIRALDDYLNPIRNTRWEIGQMVSLSQLELRLNMEKKQAFLRRMMATASYSDASGSHETGLEQMRGNPFVIVTGGRHRIHFSEWKADNR